MGISRGGSRGWLAGFGAALWAMLSPACSASSSLGNGVSCSSDGACSSGHCVDGECAQCVSSADCQAGWTCNENTCMGCLASVCPSGMACNPSTGLCYANPVTTTPPPVCGQSDPSDGYDAGVGPGPSVSGSIACYTCAGCPRGAECVCGATGLVGGLRCQDPESAAACFLTGGVGVCQVFPGDCATNTQCASTPATPVCSEQGQCVECVRDSDCPQTSGAQGCFDGKCGGCCASNAECPAGSPVCVTGFCYAGDAGSSAEDASTGLPDAASMADGPTGSSDAGSATDADAATPVDAAE